MKDGSARRRILVIDDNNSIHEDFRKTLGQESPMESLAAAASMVFDDPVATEPSSDVFDVDTALQGELGYQMLQTAVASGRPYAMAFVDMRMPPGWDGVETIANLWRVDPELQVVICTAHTDYSWSEIVEKLGKTDRLLILKKPFDPMEVCQLATSLCEKWKLKKRADIKQEELQKMVEERTAELHVIAMMDKLTGLPNRACLQDKLHQITAGGTGKAGDTFALLFIDFDRFKLVNDGLGHQVGDQLLVEISARLRRLVDHAPDQGGSGGSTFVARLGGDEFVVLQEGIQSVAEAEALANRLLLGLGVPYCLSGQVVHSTASIGIAVNDSARHWGDELLREADTAMYRAKSLGRSRYAIFSPEMQTNAIARMTLENDLRLALELNQLYLEYQPIVALADSKLEGFEALLRWNHPKRGLISPVEFIPIAEETGLILPIGTWVLGEAVRQLADWRKRLPEAADLEMSVNCSQWQLAEGTFASLVEGVLSQFELPTHCLNLEITESAVIDRPEQTLQTIRTLKAAGIRFHMDDFGTGYSSLAYLHLLQVHALKIDRSFVSNITLRRDYASVVNSIIQLAQNLGMEVIAEGVETAEHAAMLCALDCGSAQGYFFSKPLPALAAEQFILAPMHQPLLQMV